MSCGTPALVGPDTAAAIGAPDGLVTAALVEGDGAEDAWVDAVRAAVARADRDALATRAAAFARERWSWRACAASYRALLARLAPRR